MFREIHFITEALTGPLEDTAAITTRFAEVLEPLGPLLRMAMKGYDGNGKFYGTVMNFMIALNYEMMNAKFHDFATFMKRACFPNPEWNSQERTVGPLIRPLETINILDFVHSKDFDDMVISSLRPDPNFLGGSAHYSKLMKEIHMNEADTNQTNGGATDDDDEVVQQPPATTAADTTEEKPPQKGKAKRK